MKKRILLKVLCIFISLALHAKEFGDKDPISYGLKAGVTYSSIANLKTTILSETYFLNYTLKSKGRFGWAAGGYINYRFQPALALHFEMMFAKEGSDLDFDNTAKDFNYRMQLY